MLNLIPKSAASVSLLRGKRPLQRIKVGSSKHQLEVPQGAVDALYAKVDSSVSLHNKNYQTLPWKDFFSMKVNSSYLMEAALEAGQSRSALKGLEWFGDLADVYQANAVMTHAGATAAAAAALAAAKPTPFPVGRGPTVK